MKTSQEAAELRRLWGGFWSSRVLLTANNFRIFDHLTKPQSATEISMILQADPRGVEILLDALAGLGLVIKRGGRYSNAPLARKFLVSGAPWYMGDIIKHADSLWQSWSGLDSVVKNGEPNRAKSPDQNAFIRGMHNLATLKARDVIKAIGLKGVKRALDLGGGPGTYSMAMARQGVAVTLFDLPETLQIAREVIAEAGVDGINLCTGDIIQDEFGNGYDLIFISQVFHSFSAEINLKTLTKCLSALNSGGRVVIQEFFLDNSRTSPTPSALFSVNMLVNTTGGRCYAPAEMSKWLKKAGFRSTLVQRLDDTVLVSGAA